MSVVRKKINVKKDDIVQVVTGKERGKKGKILALFPESGTVLSKNLICLRGI